MPGFGESMIGIRPYIVINVHETHILCSTWTWLQLQGIYKLQNVFKKKTNAVLYNIIIYFKNNKNLAHQIFYLDGQIV